VPDARPRERSADEEPAGLRVARGAEFAFLLLTLFFAWNLRSDSGAERQVLVRLLFEAMLALAVVLGLARRPRATRVLAIVLAGYVLLGCIAHVARVSLAPPAGDPSAVLALVLVFGACACQLAVLAGCLAARLPPEPAPEA
jgi:hypothetical protein